MLLRWLTALVCSLALAGATHAADVLPVPPLSGRVIDQTATLDAAQRQALDAQLAALEQARGAQVVILLVPTTQPEDIAAYAQRVADSWKIGRREVGDGVLVVVAKSDRRVRIEVAKTLEGAIPDLAARRIIDDAIAPAFKAGDFAGGLRAAITQIDRHVGAEGLPAPTEGAADPGLDLQDLAIFLFVAAPVLGALLTGLLGRKLGAIGTGGAIGAVSWWLTASLLLAGIAALVALLLVGVIGIGSRGGGIGGRRGGPVIWGGGGGSSWGGGHGGGFRSGGGGDFGGGGASGSW